MAKPITGFDQVITPNLTDVIYAVQGYQSPTVPGTSNWETVAQLLSLLQPGTNISINTVGNSIVIASIGTPGVGVFHVTTLTQQMNADNIYVADTSSGTCVLTLPTTAAFGTTLGIQGKGVSGWKVAQNVGQQIIIGSSASTSGASGFIASTNANDSLQLICTVANTTWSVFGAPQGNITVN